jgi:hypothetical protein
MLTKEMVYGKIDEVIQLFTVQTRAVIQAEAMIQNQKPYILHATENHILEDYTTTTPLTRGEAFFEDLDMQLLWGYVVAADPVYRVAHYAVARGDRSLPSNVDKAIQMLDCSCDKRGMMCYRDIV